MNTTPIKITGTFAGAVALVVFALCFALGAWLLPRLELRPGGYPGKFTFGDERDSAHDSFFVSRGHHELSHLALYHDIGASIDHARQADIVIIGNSRGQLGFSEAVFVEQAEKLGLRVFNLSVGHSDNARFAREIIRRHDLRPRVVISNGGWFFYGDSYSEWARAVVGMSRWQALKAFFEYSLAWEVESRLHRYLPYLDQFEKHRYPWIHYRSRETGWWRSTRVPGARYPIKPGSERDSYARSLPAARALKAELDSRGTQLVLTILPFRLVQTGHLPYLSEQLGVPYIIPPFDDLATADASHLTPDSAERASRYIWQRLLALPAVREKLSLGG